MDFHLAQHYTRQEIQDSVGGNVEQYLPTKEGRVVCDTFRLDANPGRTGDHSGWQEPQNTPSSGAVREAD